jgi:hypothetical protein
MLEPTYLTTSGVAKAIDRSTDRVRQLTQQGELIPAIVTSRGDRLYTEEEVKRYLKRRRDRSR